MAEAPGLGNTPVRGMGRGLAAILPRTHDAVEGLRDLPLELVKPNERQPRREFDQEALAALAESVRTRGVLQPIVVRPLPGGSYELVAGERRVRAARIAGLETVPALVRAADDWERLDLALAENMAREDLNPVEEARACAMLVDDLGLSKGEVGRRVGRSRVAISNLVRLLELPEPVLELIESGELSEGHGRAILTCKDHEARKRLGREARDGRWSVREAERRARVANEDDTGSRQVVVHPDLAQAVAVAEDALSAALGCELTVRPRGDGCRLQIDFERPADAVALAERLLGGEASV
ncbi:MAG: ParB/RepB/Spo0J family partition protein [Solirubrobacteraceae bacterium]